MQLLHGPSKKWNNIAWRELDTLYALCHARSGKCEKHKKKRVHTILHCENLLLKFLLFPLGPEQAARLSFGLPKKKKRIELEPTGGLLFFSLIRVEV
jgi:hypothetical protein